MGDDIKALIKKQPYEIAPAEGVHADMVTTTFSLDGFRTVKSLGVVRGIVVRSRSILGNLAAVLQSLKGGNITVWTHLCEQTRIDAFRIMLVHAAQMGGNAIIGARYDATEIAGGVTEVLAYGTAVVVEPEKGPYRT